MEKLSSTKPVSGARKAALRKCFQTAYIDLLLDHEINGVQATFKKIIQKAKWKNPDPEGHLLYDFIYMKYLIVKSIETADQ